MSVFRLFQIRKFEWVNFKKRLCDLAFIVLFLFFNSYCSKEFGFWLITKVKSENIVKLEYDSYLCGKLRKIYLVTILI